MADAGEATSSIIALIVGVGVAVLILIFVGSMGGQTYNLVQDDIAEIGNNIVLGDGFTALNQTGVKLDHSFIQEGTLAIYNVSNYVNIGLGNFTIDYSGGYVTLKAVSNKYYNNTAMAANYTWGASEIRASVGNSIVSSFGALEKTGNYLPIIVLAVVISLVLMLVLGFTMRQQTNGGGAL